MAEIFPKGLLAIHSYRVSICRQTIGKGKLNLEPTDITKEQLETIETDTLTHLYLGSQAISAKIQMEISRREDVKNS